MKSRIALRALLRRDAARHLSIQTLVTAGLVAVLAAAPAAAQTAGRLASAALHQVAVEHGLDAANLSIASSARATYPLSKQIANTFKVIDAASGETYSVALDDSARVVEPLVLELTEKTANDALYGRIDPRLFDRLPSVTEGSAIAVAVWLAEPQSEGAERMSPEEAELALQTDAARDAYLGQVDQVRSAFVGSIVAPVAGKLGAQGIEFTTDDFTPVLHAFLTPAQIRDVATWTGVERIYLSPTHESDLDIARQTIFAHVVNAMGITGAGVRVGQIEVGGRVATYNPYLLGVVQDPTFVCAGVSPHSTAVAGMIRSTHTLVRGIAYNCWLYAAGSCGGISAQLQNRATAATAWGATALNLSFGANIGLSLGPDDRFFDGMVINRARTIVKSAGNENGLCNSGNGNVTSPGLAYNVITVGNFDDKNTVNWVGDTIEPCSSYKDPNSTHGDREKPELAAPGTNFVSTTVAAPWVGPVGSGTSYAAPMVTGSAALMMQRNPALNIWPESVKAILMATATHNIEGLTRLSEYDGAGGIVDHYADSVVRRVMGNWGGVSYTCSSALDVDETSMYLAAGRRVRVVIAWDNDPAYTNWASQPCADLDLRVMSPTGVAVASSNSWDNTYEIAEFTPAVSGTYTLRVHKFRCDYNPRYLGWAWFQLP